MAIQTYIDESRISIPKNSDLDIIFNTTENFAGTLLVQINECSHVNFYYHATTTPSRQQLNFHVNRDAELTLIGNFLSFTNGTCTTEVLLNDPGATCTTKIIANAVDTQCQTFNTIIHNIAPHTTGTIIQHGLANNEAQLKMHTLGQINEQVNGAKANQMTRILTLTSACKAQIDPILLIANHDVEAGHAASIGRIDGYQLYYLMSRGISQTIATQMIAISFFRSISDNSPFNLRDTINKDITRELIQNAKRES